VQNQKIIILNGRKYDALTGKPIGGSMSDIVVPNKPETTPQTFNPTKAKFIDDFAPKLSHIPLKLAVKPSEVSQSFKQHTHHHAEDIKRELAKSKTLMRKPLKKPVLVTPSLVSPIKKTGYVSRANPVLGRANYTDSFRHSIINRTQEIKQKATQAISTIGTEPPISSSSVHEKNIKKIESMPEDQLYQQAITSINDPVKTKKKKSKKKLFKLKYLYIVSGVVLFLVILASCAWYFKYDLELDYANLKTGLHGSFPNFVPLGYKIDKFSYSKSSGTASINFQYHPGHSLLNQNLYFSETSSTLDDSGLVQTDIGPVSQEKYTTLSDNGLSVYHYSDQYIWLNAGILYILTNQTGLTQPTVLKIINSV
jgi:hypothetical protein